MSTTSGHERIVVGIDGSPTANAALAWAIDEARLRGRGLRVIQVFPALISIVGTRAHEYLPQIEKEEAPYSSGRWRQRPRWMILMSSAFGGREPRRGFGRCQPRSEPAGLGVTWARAFPRDAPGFGLHPLRAASALRGRCGPPRRPSAREHHLTFAAAAKDTAAKDTDLTDEKRRIADEHRDVWIP